MSGRNVDPANPDRLRNLLAHLVTFLAVAETRSFRKAALRLSKSQPVVSTQIRELENLLGTSLFVRNTRNVQMTPSGRLLADRARPVLEASLSIVRDFRNEAALVAGHLHISVSPTVAIGWIPATLRELAKAHPRVHVSIREDMAEGLFAATLDGTVNFGIGPFGPVPSGLVFTPLATQHFCLVVRPDDPLASGEPIGIEDIPVASIMCAGVGTGARRLVEAAFAGVGRTLSPRYEAQHTEAVLGMVAEGLGVAVIPFAGARSIRARDLVGRMILGSGLCREIGLVEARGTERSPAAWALVKAFPAEPD